MPQTGLNSWLYASFPVWTPSYTLENAITQIDRAGFDTIEIGAASPHAWPQYMRGERLERLQSHLADSGIEAASICPALGGGPGPNPASPLEEEREAAREHYMGCIDVAEAFDAGIVIWVGGWKLENQRHEDAWANMRGVFEDVVEEAEDRGVRIPIEANPADVNLIMTPDDQQRLGEEVPSDTVGYMVDTAHAHHLGDSPAAYVDQLGEDLLHVHLSDTDRKPPGEGGLHFQPFLDRLAEVGYEGVFMTEIFGGHLTPDEAAVATRTNVEAMLADAY